MIHKFFKKILNRFIFLVKYGSLKSIKLLNDREILVCTSKGIFKINRRCPHQGAYLEKSFKKDNVLTCHWHGCKIL